MARTPAGDLLGVWESYDHIVGAGGWVMKGNEADDGTGICGSDACGPHIREPGSLEWRRLMRVGQVFDMTGKTLGAENTFDVDLCQTESDSLAWVVSGKLFYTHDRGQTVQQNATISKLFGTGQVANGNAVNRQTGKPLAFDPNNKNVIFCGFDDGMQVSIDGGVTFTTIPLATLPGPRPINSMSFASGVAAWAVGDIVTGSTSGAIGIIMAAQSSSATGTLYYGVVSGAFVNGENLTVGGTTRAVVNDSTPNDRYAWSRYCVSFDRSGPVTGGRTQVINILVPGHGVYRTTNAGGAWTLVSGSPIVGAHLITSEHNGWMYVAGQSHNQNNGPLSYWDTTDWISNGINTKCPAVSPHNAGHVYICNDGGGIQVSTNHGVTYASAFAKRRVAVNIPWHAWTNEVYMSHGIMIFDRLVNRIWVHEGIGAWRLENPPTAAGPTIDLLETSVGIENMVSTGLRVNPNGTVLYPCHDRTCYAIKKSQIGVTYPQTNGIDNDISILHTGDMNWSGEDPKFLVTTTFDGATVPSYHARGGWTADEGETWQYCEGNIASFGNGHGGGNIHAFTKDIWVQRQTNHGKILRTTDRGKTWAIHPNFPPDGNGEVPGHLAYWTDPRFVMQDEYNPTTTAYIYIPSSNATHKGVWETVDAGATFTRVFNGTVQADDIWHGKFTQFGPDEWLFCGGDNDVGIKRSTNKMRSWSTVVSTDDVFGAGSWGEVYDIAVGLPMIEGGPKTIYLAGYRNETGGPTTFDKFGYWMSTDNLATVKRIFQFNDGHVLPPVALAGCPLEFGLFYTALASQGLIRSKLVDRRTVTSGNVGPSPGVPGDPNAEPVGYDIIPMHGDSNSHGMYVHYQPPGYERLPTQTHTPGTKAFRGPDAAYAGLTPNTITDVTTPCYSNSANPEYGDHDFVGVGERLLTYWKEHHPNRIPILVPFGRGGASLLFAGAPSVLAVGGSVYEGFILQVIAAYNQCKAEYASTRIAMIGWAGPSNDVNNAANTEALETTELTKLFNDMRTRLPEASQVPISTMGLHPGMAGATTTGVRNALAAVHAALPKMTLVIPADTPEDDTLHPNPPSVETAANAMADGANAFAQQTLIGAFSFRNVTTAAPNELIIAGAIPVPLKGTGQLAKLMVRPSSSSGAMISLNGGQPVATDQDAAWIDVFQPAIMSGPNPGDARQVVVRVQNPVTLEYAEATFTVITAAAGGASTFSRPTTFSDGYGMTLTNNFMRPGSGELRKEN